MAGDSTGQRKRLTGLRRRSSPPTAEAFPCRLPVEPVGDFVVQPEDQAIGGNLIGPRNNFVSIGLTTPVSALNKPCLEYLVTGHVVELEPVLDKRRSLVRRFGIVQQDPPNTEEPPVDDVRFDLLR